MKNLTSIFSQRFSPVKSLLIYYRQDDHKTIYVESYDIGRKGKPINAHPLSKKESDELATALLHSTERLHEFLKPKGFIPLNVLHINPKESALWYTPAQSVSLLFKNSLGIDSGKAFVPPMLWKASANQLNVYALKTGKPKENTTLFQAPFFNVSSNGAVCMGSVDVSAAKEKSLEDFLQFWQDNFFRSYFTHLNGDNPVDTNIVSMWKSLVGTDKPFPLEVLKKSTVTIKHLLS